MLRDDSASSSCKLLELGISTFLFVHETLWVGIEGFAPVYLAISGGDEGGVFGAERFCPIRWERLVRREGLWCFSPEVVIAVVFAGGEEGGEALLTGPSLRRMIYARRQQGYNFGT